MIIEIISFLAIIVCLGVVTLLIAAFFAYVVGTFQGVRSATFKSKAAKRARENGEEFLIIAGDPALVQTLYSVCVKTSAEAEQIALKKREEAEEGIALDDGK